MAFQILPTPSSMRMVPVALLCAALPATLWWKPPIVFLWNASPSVPIGLYRIEYGSQLTRGEMAIASVPERFRSLAARRGYVPATVPLVKRIAASGGDRVCARGPILTINGRAAAVRLGADGNGRVLPWWSGCRILGPNEILLLGDARESFDGRYFGPTRRSDMLGEAVPL